MIISSATSTLGYLVEGETASADQAATLSEAESLVGSFEKRGGGWVLKVTGLAEPVGWLEDVVEAFDPLLNLGANWDSYGGRPVSKAQVESALALLIQMMREETPLPSVVPTSQGGIQMEWHCSGVDLEIETLPAGNFLVLFEDSRSDNAWDRELPLGDSLLSQVFERLVDC